MDRRMRDVEGAVEALRLSGLVRRSGAAGSEPKVTLFHDAVRRAATAELQPGELAGAREAYARWLAGTRAAAHRLVRHYLDLGDVGAAARLAREAARSAEDRRAYGFAAEMYEVALREPAPEEAELLHARARALCRSGSYAEAAPIWRRLGAGATTDDARLEFCLEEAQALLGAHRIVEGRQRLDAAFTELGRGPVTRPSARGALDLALFVVGPVGAPRRAGRALRADELTRAEREIRIGQMIGYFEPRAGVAALMRARAVFLRDGADEGASWAEYILAVLAMFGARRAGQVPLAQRYARSAARRLVGTPNPHREVVACAQFVEAYAAMRSGAWDEAVRAVEAALDLTTAAGLLGTHAHLFALQTRAEVELWRQDFASFRVQSRRFRAAVIGTAAEFPVAAHRALDRYAAGDFAGAAEALEGLARAWPADVPTIQLAMIKLFLALFYALDGHVGRAWSIVRARGEGLDPIDSINGGFLAAIRARVELMALRDGLPGASAQRVRRLADLQAGAAPIFATQGLRVHAFLEDWRGHRARAMELLARAEAEALALNQRLDAAAALFARGRRLGGSEGALLCARARSLAVSCGAGARHIEADDPIRT
jgi:hypothetical protein